MFYEKQVQITNNALKFLKKEAEVIPSKMTSYLYLTESEFPYNIKHKDEIVPSPDKNFYIKSKKLSNIIKYDDINFKKKISPRSVNFHTKIPITKSGKINGLLIYSDIILPSGLVIKRYDTTFLNGDDYCTNPSITVLRIQ
jgi:predicted RNA methylase